jgi:RNA polymerase sigma-70 factor, ECF subfamily
MKTEPLVSLCVNEVCIEGSNACVDRLPVDAELKSLRDRLLRRARCQMRDPAVAEDLVQDTLVTVVERHSQRRGESSLATWATAILKHKVADWYRSPSRRRTLDQYDQRASSVDDAAPASDPEFGDTLSVPSWQQPENRSEQRQMMATVRQCLADLPRQQGHVFVMREWLGFETFEICDRLGISPDNCRTILHRTRSALRTRLQRDGSTCGPTALPSHSRASSSASACHV